MFNDFPQPVSKPKKTKDPNAPKKPMTSYFLFLADKRNEIKAGLPED
jgi:hypothetical protein